MKNHKYRVGQMVTFLGTGMFAAAAGRYEVTRLLPETGRSFQYRIKSLVKGDERVVREEEIQIETAA